MEYIFLQLLDASLTGTPICHQKHSTIQFQYKFVGIPNVTVKRLARVLYL
jgi:hypothetical protein